MRYQVAVYANSLGQWVLIGPVFGSPDEATQFLQIVPAPFKRVVGLPQGADVEANGAANGAANGQPEDQPDGSAELDQRRLGFARYLVETGRLNED